MKERHYIRDSLSFNLAVEYPFSKRWVALLEMYSTWTWTNISPPQGFQSPSTLVGILPGIEFFINEKWAVSAGAGIDLFGKSGSFMAFAKSSFRYGTGSKTKIPPNPPFSKGGELQGIALKVSL